MLRQIVKRPAITEKSLQLAQQNNVYVFIVSPRTNKDQIKHEVEELFGVDVVSVRTVMQPPRVKKTGPKRRPTAIASKKKAFIKIKEGQKIELFDVIGE